MGLTPSPPIGKLPVMLTASLGREANRSARAGTDKIRDGHQSQDCKGSRPHSPCRADEVIK
jgi:hypothetical protein